jgi:hypothetical protein
VGRTRKIFGVDWKKEGAFLMSTMTLICPIQMLKLLAGRLWIGGTCKYVLKEGSGITGNFLLERVVPSIRTWFTASVATVLALPLLWTVFKTDDNYLLREMMGRIQAAVRQVSQLADDKNPVKKVVLVVSGNEGKWYLDELEGDEGRDGEEVMEEVMEVLLAVLVRLWMWESGCGRFIHR